MSIIDKNISIKIENVQKSSWNAFCADVSPRPYAALLFRKNGSASLKHDTLTVDSNAGDITYMPSNYAYHAEYFNDNEVFYIHFYSDAQGEIENFTLPNPDSANQLFAKAFDIWMSHERGNYFRTAEIFYQILALICNSDKTTYTKNRYPDFFSAVDYLKTNFSNSALTVSELALMANMSETYFRKLFTKTFSQTPISYITKLRLEYAEKLLSDGKCSIEEVARKSGFNDAKYFSRVVKNIYGYPPSKLFIHF